MECQAALRTMLKNFIRLTRSRTDLEGLSLHLAGDSHTLELHHYLHIRLLDLPSRDPKLADVLVDAFFWVRGGGTYPRRKIPVSSMTLIANLYLSHR